MRPKCAFCGGGQNLRPTILVTYAQALTCRDVVACERRRYRLRQGIAS